MKKVKAFFAYDFRMKKYLVEALMMLAYGRFLKMRPFHKVAPSLGKNMDETPYELIDSSQKLVLREIARAIRITSKHTPWDSSCLVRAIAVMKMLERREIESTIYLGTAKDPSGKLIAHAWLRSGPYYLTGHEEMNKFVVVGQFANSYGRSQTWKTHSN